MKAIAIIPARGGSVSIPRKNLMPYKNLPLIAHSILYAKKNPLIHRTIVSTDDEIIASVAKKYGAEIPFIRPKSLAGDLVPTFPVIKHALDKLQDDGYLCDVAVVLEPTIPERPDYLIEECLNIFSANPDCDTILSMYKSPIPIQKIYSQEGKFIKNIVNESVRQDFKQTFCFSQHFKAYRSQCILNNTIQTGYGNYIMPLMIKEETPSFDIDVPDDLKRFLLNPTRKWWQ